MLDPPDRKAILLSSHKEAKYGFDSCRLPATDNRAYGVYARLFTSDASISNAAETGSTLDGEVEAGTHIFALSGAYRF